MSQTDTAHAWWSRLRHQGLLLSPVVMIEKYPTAPAAVAFHVAKRLRDAHTRFTSRVGDEEDRNQAAVLGFVDSVLEDFIGHPASHVIKQHSIPDKYTFTVRIGSKTETLRPHRILYTDDSTQTPALLVMADSSAQVGRGKGRTVYARFLELLRGTGHRLGLLTNGQQFRLIYAGLDFESWCEWESDRWFDDGEGTEELLGLRQMLSAESLTPLKPGVSGLLDAVEESRKRQADLSSVLRENVRQAVELLLEDVSTANRSNAKLFQALVQHGDDRPLTDAEAHEALMQASVRLVMRMVVCLFAESRQLLPVNDPIYAQSYGVRTLYELLDEAARHEGGTHVLFNRETAWPRLMALFRLVYSGSSHGAFPMRAYGGVLFRPGDAQSADPVVRALHIFEHGVAVGDSTIYYVLRKLLRGPLPVLRGRAKTYVEGPVDYTDLRTEFIGLIYEGLLDYRVKRTDEQIGPQVFLNLGREPVLPLARLTAMLEDDKKGLKDLLTTLRKEKVTATAADEEKETDDDEAEEIEDGEDTAEEINVESEVEPVQKTGDYLDAVDAATNWAKDAVVLAGLVRKQTRRESDAQYRQEVEAEAKKLIKRVVAHGEFYLVRAGNTRKGTGTFYTRPQLAVPTVHRTLEPLCYDKAEDGTLIPKEPELILALKVCDSSCGSASFLVAALHYLTDALYKSLCYHRKLDDPEQTKKITLPFGRPRIDKEGEELVPFPPNDPQRGESFVERIKALLRRHVVERCIYGVDINPLAVELARVSLWVETLDPELPFSFLDHKIKVGNSLVGCWLDRVEDYPLKAWEREGGDGKDGPRTLRIEEALKGEKIGTRRSGDGRIKKEMRQVIESRFSQQPRLFIDEKATTESVVALARAEYEQLHELPIGNPDERERFYREHIEGSQPLRTLTAAMDEWCAVWFWPTDEESLRHAPTPLTFHKVFVEKDALVKRLAKEVKFFHWEMEFPDVFTSERTGFDAMIGNPPWDVIEPKSQEFFSDFDPLFRTYDKQAALRHQKEMFGAIPGVLNQWDEYIARFKALSNWIKGGAEPFDLPLSRGVDDSALKSAWAKHRLQNIGFTDPAHPYILIGAGKPNAYKLFTEMFWHLLRKGGRIGVILPTGIYSDLGTRTLRETLIYHGQLDFLYAFQNEKNIFSSATHSIKQTVLIGRKGGCTKGILARFRMGVGDSPHAHELSDDILIRDKAAMYFTPEDIKSLSPKTLSLVELRNDRDLRIFRTIYSHSIRIGDNAPGWEINFAQELNMTSDSKFFPPLEKWQAMGYRPNVFDVWVGPEGDVALPLYEGSMIFHYDCAYQGWQSGHGASSIWPFIPFDSKAIRPRFLVSPSGVSGSMTKLKVVFRPVARNNLTRTMTAVCCALPCGNSLSTLVLRKPSIEKSLYLQSLLDSFCFDFVVRARTAGLNLNWFLIEDCPLASAPSSDMVTVVSERAARLTFLHRRFAPEWLVLKRLYPQLCAKEWKHWWAVTEADRLRLRVEIDALCADLYGLEPDDFDWIVRDDPKDPKGFYRVDRQLPFRERLTGLAATAFRALKECKWSAESAAKLSNDEFFEIIGIPELTTGPEPLIKKRDGCHLWEPEKFAKDDPRYGWTWDHCWQDAVALLGSEDAVRRYVEGKQEEIAKPQEEVGPKDLYGNPLPTKTKQPKLF